MDDILNISKSVDVDIIKITIFDSTGKKVLTFNGDISTLNLGQLTSGLYIIQFQTTNGFKQYKFIKN